MAGFLWLLSLLGASSAVLASPIQVRDASSVEPSGSGHWVDTFTTMPQLTEPANLPNPPFNTTGLVFGNSTIRQTLHVSIGAPQIRLRFSNAFGVNDLPITAVTVALPDSGLSGTPLIQPGTVQKVTFDGNESFTVPNGALVVSDPIDFPVEAQSIFTVTMYLADGQVGNSITSHPGSRVTTWMTFGNQISATNITGPDVQSVAHWYFISAVEGWVPTSSRAFAIVGDSITDGRGSDTDKNNRWPDLVLAKMQKNPATANIAVVNQAAGGNRILYDGLGPNALGRIDRDVLAQSGIKYAMIFEGVNDIGVADNTTAAQRLVGDRLISAYKQIVARVHTFGIPMFAATITPFSAPPANASVQPYSDPTREATRQRVNTFIKTSGLFDAVIDFDKVVRDPNAPSQLNPAFNSGDFLHPNDAGYQAIAEAFPLDVFTKFKNGVSTWS